MEVHVRGYRHDRISLATTTVSLTLKRLARQGMLEPKGWLSPDPAVVSSGTLQIKNWLFVESAQSWRVSGPKHEGALRSIGALTKSGHLRWRIICRGKPYRLFGGSG